MKKMILYFILLCIGSVNISYAQVSCAEDFQGLNLADLFGGISLPFNAGFYKINKECNYPYEGNAFVSTNYKLCSNWEVHKRLEYIDEGILNSFIAIHDRASSVNISKLGIENRFTYTSLSGTALGARQRLAIVLFSKKLKLPPHNFNVKFNSPPTTAYGGFSNAVWKSDNFWFDILVPIPVPQTPVISGSFELGLTGNYSDISGTVSDRRPFYKYMKSYSNWGQPVPDWDNYPDAQPITQMNYWDDYHLSNSYKLTVNTPWLGPLPAKLRLSLSATIGGELKFNEKFDFIEPNQKHLCPTLLARFQQQHTLTSNLNGNGKIVLRISVPFKTIRKEFTVISGGNSNEVDFYNNALNVTIPMSVGGCQLGPCVNTPSSLNNPPVFTNLTGNRPSPDTDDDPVNPSDWAEDVVQAIEDTYYICDKNKKLWKVENDGFITKLTRAVNSRQKKEADAAKELMKYLKANVFLCEKTCSDVCLLKETETYFETEQQTKEYLKETGGN